MWFRRLYSVLSLSKTKMMNLEKCYFRHIPQEYKLDITFLLKVKDSFRQFNFSRKPDESVNTLLVRIGANVQRAVNKANKKKDKSSSEVSVNIYRYNDTPLPEDSICMDLFEMRVPLKLKIEDQVYDIVFNSPWVVSMNLPQSILAGFPIYPENFMTYYSLKEKSIFNWYRGMAVNDKGNKVSEIHIQWNQVGNGFSYTPDANDIGMKLKLECVPGNEGELGPPTETISKNNVEAGPGYCPFETRHKFTTSPLKDKSFRCVSYNILADLYCDSDYTRTVLHPYCPPYALQIDYRKQLILKEISGYNADLLCLQEVDAKVFKNCLLPYLESNGFDGVFHKKGKEVAEGLACFFRRDRFRLLEENRIVLAEALKTHDCLRQIWDSVKSNGPFVERLLDRSTVASAVILQSLDNKNEIVIVGNTHLYFHPDSDHIRITQGGIVIYWLQDVRRKLEAKYPGKRISVIICGDFNSVPSAGVYQLYTTGTASNTLPDWLSNEKEAVHNLSLSQDIILGSACGTPQYTNFTAGFADCLDYIYFEKANLEVEQVVPLPSVEELTAHTALPSIVFPSDHLSLVADLRFK